MNINKPLWSHQQAALDYSLAHEREAAGPHPGAGLWYEMGTGKTLTTLAVLSERRCRRVLVIAPSVVCNTWPQQVAEHTDGFPVCEALTRGSVKQRLARLGELWRETSGEFIAAVNYEATQHEPMKSSLIKADWDAVILDEAHRGKGPTTKVAKWLREKLYPRARHVQALTGTPLPNGYGDSYGLYANFAPATFNVKNWTHFRNRYAVRGNPRIPQQITAWRDTEELDRLMALHAISCKADDVLDLPDRVHETVWVELDGKTQDAYQRLEADLIAEIEQGDIVAANALVKALRLQQLAGGVAVVGEGEEATPHRLSREKLDAFAEMLSDIDAHEPVVLFGQFSADVQGALDVALRCKRPAFEVSGRIKQVGEWAESAARGEGPVACVQIAAGGLGINEFVAARFAFFLSTGYSSSAFRQAIARLHRPGQSRKVIYYHIAARGTIDVSIADALQRKGDLEAAVMERLGYGLHSKV